jgi:DNA mismatch repair protein MutS2
MLMASRFTPGDTVQTRFGKGVVREMRNGGRLNVEVHGRAMVVAEGEISALDDGHKRSRARPVVSERGSERASPQRAAQSAFAEIDLHGMTAEQALDRVQDALSAALLADLTGLRLIHGRSGGRIRAALHRHLRETRRRFRLDPQNEGVTIVSL